MSQTLFTRIVQELTDNTPHFQQDIDCMGKVDISPLMKCTSVILQLTYGAIPNAIDEYLQISEKTSRDSLNAFYKGIMDLYRDEYLRRPANTDVERLYAFYEEKHEFPRMLGSIDYTDWLWSSWPTPYRAQYCRVDHGRIHSFYERCQAQDFMYWAKRCHEYEHVVMNPTQLEWGTATFDQNRYPVDTSLIHIESRKSPTAVLFDVDTRRIFIRHCETEQYHSECSSNITRIMRKTL
ncbi:F-box/kelch-repeat protein-like protein [Tanacetum coccineum]